MENLIQNAKILLEKEYAKFKESLLGRHIEAFEILRSIRTIESNLTAISLSIDSPKNIYPDILSDEEIKMLIKECVKEGVRKNWEAGSCISWDVSRGLIREFIHNLNYRPGLNIWGSIFCELFTEGCYFYTLPEMLAKMEEDVPKDVKFYFSSLGTLPITKEIAKIMGQKLQSIELDGKRIIRRDFSKEEREEGLKNFCEIIDKAELIVCSQIENTSGNWGSYATLHLAKWCDE